MGNWQPGSRDREKTTNELFDECILFPMKDRKFARFVSFFLSLLAGALLLAPVFFVRSESIQYYIVLSEVSFLAGWVSNWVHQSVYESLKKRAINREKKLKGCNF